MDPVIFNIPEWTWQKIATGVTTGIIHRLTTVVYYYQTYRLTGEAAPTTPTIDIIPDEAARIFDQLNYEPINSAEPIDIYIMCANQDDDANDIGKIRVDV